MPWQISGSGAVRKDCGSSLASFFGGWIVGKPWFYRGWQGDGKKFQKSPQATCIDDDNYYEGSLGHTGRLPGPEAAVPNQRGIRHGFNSKH
jgi:hypothetical protein